MLGLSHPVCPPEADAPTPAACRAPVVRPNYSASVMPSVYSMILSERVKEMTLWR